ncbi:cadherin-like domain-containing protein, partial [Azohydromonas lata]|uniref:cadherin-like domain-containing protein n=1 Tax=Azohydromonas lata TaxID=45677 RepID=UPI000AA05C6A
TGTLTLSYGVSDGAAVTPATRVVAVAAANVAPALGGAPAVLAAARAGISFTLTQAQLLQGFTDANGDLLSVTALAADHGTAVRNADGSWTVTAAAGYTGALTLSYGVGDGAAVTPATLVMAVATANVAPVLSGAPAVLAQARAGLSFTVTQAQLLQGFTDADGNLLSVTALAADHGTVLHNADGSWTVTAAAGYTGALTLSYGVSDGVAVTAATRVVAVAAANVAPVLGGVPAVLAAASAGVSFTVTQAQLLQGYTDANGDLLSVTALAVDHGTVAQNPDGSWSVTAAAGYTGALTLSYAVSDGHASTAATRVVAVTVANAAPALSGPATVLAEATVNVSFTVTQAQLLQGYTDAESEALSVTSLAADHGTVVRNADGNWTITPVAGYSGQLRLSYRVSDGVNSTSAILAVQVAKSTSGFAITNVTGSQGGSGYSVSGAGDVNGDGLADLIVGVPNDAAAGTNAGRSFVLFGRTGAGTVDLSALAAGSGGGFVINGQAANSQSGYSVSGAGDVNGDGLMDLIVGAPTYGTNVGHSYVVFGRNDASAVSLAAVAAGSGGFVINGQSN